MRILLTFAVLAYSLSGFCQKLKYSLDVQSEYNQIEYFFRQEKQLGLSLIKQNHRLRLAPIFQVYTNEARENIRGFEFTGASVSYIYNCGSNLSFIDFFFKYEGTYQFFSNQWTSTQYNSNSQLYEEYDFESLEFFSAQTLGYGFSIDLWKGIYLQNSIGLGVRISSLNGESNSPENLSTQVFDFRGYSDFGFHWKAGVAIGYRF